MTPWGLNECIYMYHVHVNNSFFVPRQAHTNVIEIRNHDPHNLAKEKQLISDTFSSWKFDNWTQQLCIFSGKIDIKSQIGGHESTQQP